MVNRKKKKVFKIRYLLSFILIVYIGSILFNQHKMIVKLEAEKQKKEQEIKALKTDISQLESKIDYTYSLEYIEKIAREELNMVKPGEIIYIDKEKKKSSVFGRD
ncbi:FtsB family cell division protein [Thermohalobacter berrensis]|uniref:Septum formation initiator n=1 Tax=Thermohalobacter berrensis TaxID=99594 RepID=A0A419T8X8_9FIRM|nr:septum formation initiator family protein [Thermohalobacter berrensis]RKD33888.1 hypothetical protein BET03_08140 [Thermohalobacter berrensis]